MNTVPLTTELEWNNQCIFSTSFFVKFVTVLCLKNCILRSLSRIATLVLDVTDCYRRTMVFMSVCWSQPQALQKRLNRLRCHLGPRNSLLGGAQISPGEGAIKRWGHLLAHWYSQTYLVGGSSSAPFRCQYCSDLFSFSVPLHVVYVS